MPLINRMLKIAKQLPIYTGEYVIYGDVNKGWIEMLTDGILTIRSKTLCDIYLLENGGNGSSGSVTAIVGGDTRVYTGGDGGTGGDYREIFGVRMSGKSLPVSIGKNTTLGEYTTSGQKNGASGGSGGYSDPASASTPTAGSSGRRPFANNSPMASGFAAKALGAGGGGGGANGESGGNYGGGRGGSSGRNAAEAGGLNAIANTGSGGGGGGFPTSITIGQSTTYSYAGSGGSGIAIVRWGY